MKKLTSVDGSQSYLLVSCHLYDQLWGISAGSKSPPLVWLNRLLTLISPDVQGKYVNMDLGGELGRNLEVQKLFSKHGYDIRPTTPDAFHENSLVERPHQTIGDAMQAMLESASLPLKYWPYALYHFIQLYNFIPHGNNTVRPF